MVIGGSKRDATQESLMSTKESGVSAAAAIVVTATRGLNSSAKLDDDSTKKSVMTADAVAAIVLQATRGSSRPPISDAPGNRAHSFRSGNFADGKSGTPGPIDLSGLSAGSCGESSDKTGNMILTNVIEKTAALAAASEADSSEASLTREQRLKAERLKKAKMFAAMIKSSRDGKAKLFPPASVVLSGPQPASSGSMLSGPDNATMEREGSSVPVTANAMDVAEDRDEKPAYCKGEQKSRKRKATRHSYDEDTEEGEKKKKCHSEHSSRHLRKRCYSSSKRKQSNRSQHHHHKHYSSEEDEHYHYRNSHRYRRESHHTPKHLVSDNHGSLWKQGQESESDDGMGSHSCSRELSMKPQDTTVAPSTLDAQPSNSTEVPDDLRAKVRVMLLATM